jgi:hypothetical protein
MSRDDDIDDQVNADREFTRRADQLLNKLRNQGTAGASPEASNQEDDDRPKEK